MLRSERILRLTLEAVLLAAISILLLAAGIFLTNNDEYERVQNEYREAYYRVLPAEVYERVNNSLVEGYSSISEVYEGFDGNGNPVGFVINLEVNDHETGNPLNLIVGVNYNTAELTGLIRSSGDDRGSSISDEEIGIIEEQTRGYPIPVAYRDETDLLTADSSDQYKVTGLQDGTYFAQTLTSDSSGYVDFVEITVENGVIATVWWDAFNTDMNIKNKREASLDGVYSVQGLNWASQSYLLCHALMDLQNPALLAMKSDGTTDIVDGVTVNIRTFYNLCVECIENSIAGFDKEDYFESLEQILGELFAGDFDSLGLVNDEGYIVFDFDEYPGVFLGEGGERINVRQKITGDMTDYSGFGADPAAASRDESGTSEGEDGVRRSDFSYEADSIDGLPMSEIKTYIDGIPGQLRRTSDIVTAVNTAYKFLKDYLNWMA